MAKRHANHLGSLESMFLRLEELVLANSGEDEFEEVFKLLVARLRAERSGHPERFQRRETRQGTFREIVRLLREAERQWPGILPPKCEPRLSPEHLEVCVEALAKHQVGSTNLEVLDSFFEFLVARAAKGAKGQYFTPRHVVEFCVRMLKPLPSETVIDPACGSGGFLFHTLNYVKREHGATCQPRLWGFDIDPLALRVAKALMVFAGDRESQLHRLNSLLRPTDASTPTIETLARSLRRGHRGFDVLLTNPPFAGEVRERGFLDTYELSKGRDKVERDVLFIERCLDLLRPGGRMAMVLPHNKFAAEGYSHVREHILQRGRVLAVVGLGRNTFLPHTHQKASILFLQKHEQRVTGMDDTHPIFFAISEKDGKNSRGQPVFKPDRPSLAPDPWSDMDHDLDEILSQYQASRGV